MVKSAAESIEEPLQELSRKIFLSGGLLRRCAPAFVASERRLESHVQAAKDSVAEIDAIGVQVKDLDTGLLDFPCHARRRDCSALLEDGRRPHRFLAQRGSGFRGRQPIDERFKKPKAKKPSLTSRISEWCAV